MVWKGAWAGTTDAVLVLLVGLQAFATRGERGLQGGAACWGEDPGMWPALLT